MQAKIIDYASDKIVNVLHKIDQKDVKKAMTSVSNKVQSKSSQEPSSLPTNRVKTSEDYCAMIKNEFDFMPPLLDEERQKGILKNKKYDTKLSVEGSVAGSGMLLN